MAANAPVERGVMGYEQKDSYDHFAGGSLCCGLHASIRADIFGLNRPQRFSQLFVSSPGRVIDLRPNSFFLV